MSEHVISLPGDTEWVVRAFSYENREEQRGEWERVQYEYRDQEGNFSIWTTTNPEQTIWLVVMCGRRETLPEIRDGEPFDLHPDDARQFALRRARVGLEGFVEGVEYVDQENRYGLEHPVTIDPNTGKVVPYRQQ